MEEIKLRDEQKNVPKGINPVNLAYPLPVNFSWTAKNASDCIIEIAKDAEFKQIVKRHAVRNHNQVEIYNLESDQVYYWHIIASHGENSVTSETKTFRTKNDPRLIYVPDVTEAPWPTKGFGPVNVRDFGGKTVVSGGKTRQSLAYRGTEFDNVYTLSPRGLELFRDELKIKTDLDFRYPANVAGRTHSAMGEDINWIHIPINAYRSFTPEQNDYFRDAIRVFANKENYPIYFHCTGGVDRTGEIAFLLNAVCDVDTEENFLDYDISSLCFFPRKRTIPYFTAWQAKISTFGKPDDSWKTKVENYLLSIGVTAEEIASIRTILVDKDAMTRKQEP